MILSVDTNKEPTTCENALKHDILIKAMNEEITALEQNTWTITSLPADKIAIGCILIYKVKYMMMNLLIDTWLILLQKDILN